jgi:hypothetical protein
MRARQAGIAIAVFLGAVAACRQLVGIGNQPPMDDAGPACGIGYSGASCEECLEQSCCTEAKACSGDMGCSALEGCIGSCLSPGDPTCRAKCTSMVPSVDSTEYDFAACMVGSCARQCSISCGGLAEMFGPDAAAGCQHCLQYSDDSVCSEAAQCAADASCQAALRCTQVGPFQDRYQACVNAQPSKIAAHQLLSDLQKSSECLTDCALGSQWSCVGHISPVTAGVNADAGFSFTDFVNQQQPTAGMLVQVCDPTAPPAQCSGQSGTTNDAGVVWLTISGSAGGAAPTGYLRMTGSQLEPVLFYWGFPTTEPSWQLFFYSFTTDDVAGLASGSGVTVDMNRAIVAVEANDCWGTYIGAPNVTFSIDPPGDSKTKLLYQVGQNFSLTANRTDPIGNAFFVNVPVGPDGGTVLVTAQPLSIETPSAVVKAYVQPGTITAILASPTPN